MDCLSNEQLFFYSEGLLETDETRRIAAHMKSCESCAARYVEEIELTVALRELPAPVPSAALPGRVISQIRAARARSSSPWWWAVAFILLVASGLRWLPAGDISPEKAALSLTQFLSDGAIAVVQLVARLSDLDTWSHLGRAMLTLAEMAAESPLWLASSVTAVFMVAVAANVLLWSLTRHALVHR
jgi:anti-sigma factor RsiW